MTKSKLIEILLKEQPHLKLEDVELAVKTILDLMSQSLADGERIEIRGFGTFSLHHYNSRTARNPKTGEHVALEKRSNVHFKPSKELKTRVDNKN